MIQLKGKYSDAKIFTDYVEPTAMSQIVNFINSPMAKNAHVRIMPDVHAGKGSVIGFTAKLGEYVAPMIIGVDIGCSVLLYELEDIDIDFEKLDKFIRTNVPIGKEIHDTEVNTPSQLKEKITDVSARIHVDVDYMLRSIGSLGGGNHYIEIGKNEDNVKFLSIHSGSRHFGFKIAQYYNNMAKKQMKHIDFSEQIEKLKKIYHGSELFKKIEELKRNYQNVGPNGLYFLTGDLKDQYLEDMKIAQEYAEYNRRWMLEKILEFFNMKFEQKYFMESVHNYINFEDKIIRKGAISAHKGEPVVIPLNMRDGIIIGIGKGNEDWNYSAPHGAGRKYSRSEAKKNITLKEFQESMKGIYSTSITESTIDESPFAYKNVDDILNVINETINVIQIVKPVYNLKA